MKKFLFFILLSLPSCFSFGMESNEMAPEITQAIALLMHANKRCHSDIIRENVAFEKKYDEFFFGIKSTFSYATQDEKDSNKTAFSDELSKLKTYSIRHMYEQMYEEAKKGTENGQFVFKCIMYSVSMQLHSDQLGKEVAKKAVLLFLNEKSMTDVASNFAASNTIQIQNFDIENNYAESIEAVFEIIIQKTYDKTFLENAEEIDKSLTK